MEYYASLETGGTKVVCAVGYDPDHLFDVSVFPTLTPQETIHNIVEYFLPHISQYKITKMGITSFGPIDINPQSSHWGYITTTPKKGWAHTNLVGMLQEKLGIPHIAFDTDVNGAALAEGKWGAAKGLHTYLYITVGTGIGIGVVVNNFPLHGLLHPEGGHIMLPLHEQDPSPGFCPYHGNCLEGLAAGPTFEKRWNDTAENLPDDHLAWELETHYLAMAIANFVCSHSPQRIILGGGISKRARVFPRIQQKVQELLNGYVVVEEILSHIEEYIVPPTLEHSGLLGGISMASKL